MMEQDRSYSRSRSRSRSESRGRKRSRSASLDEKRQDASPGGRDDKPVADPELDRKVRVRGLTRNVTEEHVKEIFETFGEIERVDFAVDDKVNLPRGFADIYYVGEQGAQDAKEYMDRGQIDGKNVMVVVGRDIESMAKRKKSGFDRKESVGYKGKSYSPQPPPRKRSYSPRPPPRKRSYSPRPLPRKRSYSPRPPPRKRSHSPRRREYGRGSKRWISPPRRRYSRSPPRRGRRSPSYSTSRSYSRSRSRSGRRSYSSPSRSYSSRSRTYSYSSRSRSRSLSTDRSRSRSRSLSRGRSPPRAR